MEKKFKLLINTVTAMRGKPDEKIDENPSLTIDDADLQDGHYGICKKSEHGQWKYYLGQGSGARPKVRAAPALLFRF